MNPKTIILVPCKKGKDIKYRIFEVDAGELSAFLPADDCLSTDNFYAAQTFCKGWFQSDEAQRLPSPAPVNRPKPGKLL